MWKPISDFTLYEVSDSGEVRIISSGQVLHQYNTGNGYLIVKLRRHGNVFNRYVHRLVAQAFIPNDDPTVKVEVDHLDHDSFNNDVSNLQWISVHDNRAKKRNHVSHVTESGKRAVNNYNRKKKSF